MQKTKQQWLFHLRRCTSRETLDKVIEIKTHSLNGAELITFFAAADHRLAEIITCTLYDKVPAPVWTLVR
ncbi:hemolysin activation protein [Escherichia coli]|nr:hemolysin activation protein [Escherichia coli]